jgi:hypothetical protein
VTELELRLRERIDALLDERWKLNAELDVLVATVREQDAQIARMHRTPASRREAYLRKRIEKLRLSARHYRQEAYRFKAQKEMWKVRAMNHERKRERERERWRRT